MPNYTVFLNQWVDETGSITVEADSLEAAIATAIECKDEAEWMDGLDAQPANVIRVDLNGQTVWRDDREPKWFVVIGRVCGDDEDSCEVFHVVTEEEAREAFREWIRPFDDDEETEIFINHVLSSSREIKAH